LLEEPNCQACDVSHRRIVRDHGSKLRAGVAGRHSGVALFHRMSTARAIPRGAVFRRPFVAWILYNRTWRPTGLSESNACGSRHRRGALWQNQPACVIDSTASRCRPLAIRLVATSSSPAQPESSGPRNQLLSPRFVKFTPNALAFARTIPLHVSIGASIGQSRVDPAESSASSTASAVGERFFGLAVFFVEISHTPVDFDAVLCSSASGHPCAFSGGSFWIDLGHKPKI